MITFIQVKESLVTLSKQGTTSYLFFRAILVHVGIEEMSGRQRPLSARNALGNRKDCLFTGPHRGLHESSPLRSDQIDLLLPDHSGDRKSVGRIKEIVKVLRRQR